ncbi:MAG: DUF896 domain-containing protein [Tissierellia bacterium]|jgi:uncharacterized protein YnzC (UPF0291/DUF896 family)|nr:DUF896 domain-containing protein [Tissierellia bacterium]
MNKELLDKINHLAHKQKTVGLTVDEVAEQKKLREEYLRQFRKAFKKRLENIDIEYVD